MPATCILGTPRARGLPHQAISGAASSSVIAGIPPQAHFAKPHVSLPQRFGQQKGPYFRTCLPPGGQGPTPHPCQVHFKGHTRGFWGSPLAGACPAIHHTQKRGTNPCPVWAARCQVPRARAAAQKGLVGAVRATSIYQLQLSGGPGHNLRTLQRVGGYVYAQDEAEITSMPCLAVAAQTRAAPGLRLCTGPTTNNVPALPGHCCTGVCGAWATSSDRGSRK